MKKKTNVKYFGNYNDLLHHVASNDYKNTITYRYSCLIIKGNKMYYNNVFKGLIDRKKEKILLLREGSGTWSWVCTLTKRAFDHYYVAVVDSFSLKEQKNMLSVMYKRMPKNKYLGWANTWSMRNLLEGYQSFCEYKQVQADEQLVSDVNKLLKDSEEKKDAKDSKDHEQAVAHSKEREEKNEYALGVISAFLDGLDKTQPVGLNIDALQQAKFYDSKLKNTDYFNAHKDYSVEDEDIDKTYFYQVSTWALGQKYTDLLKEKLGVRLIKRNSWEHEERCLPDFVWYDPTIDSFVTSQRVKVENTDNLTSMINWFATIIKTGKGLETLKDYVSKHVGPYDIREVNTDEKTIRVGCHVFTFENVLELPDQISGNTVIANSYKINKTRDEIKQLEESVETYKNKIERLKNLLAKMEGASNG